MAPIAAGAILLIAAFGLLRISRPIDGQVRPIAQHGRDMWIALAFTAGVAFGIMLLIVGITRLMN